ncbi:MAG: hypothetical protein AB8C84_08240 [Oligoflexales bacterium]
MKSFSFFIIFFSQITFGAALPKSATVFGVYGEKILASDLKKGDEIKIIDQNNKVQEAEILGIFCDQNVIFFEILDYENEDILRQMTTKNPLNRHTQSRIYTRKFTTPVVALLATSLLPVAAAGPWAAGLYAVVGTVASVGAGVITTMTTGGNVAAGLAVTTTGIEFVKDTTGLVAIIPGA